MAPETGNAQTEGIFESYKSLPCYACPISLGATAFAKYNRIPCGYRNNLQESKDVGVCPAVSHGELSKEELEQAILVYGKKALRVFYGHCSYLIMESA